MKLRIELFAGARQAADADALEVTFPAGGDCQQCLAAIADQHPSLAGLVGVSRLAIDDRYLAPHEPVPIDRPLALIPPVSGG